MVKHICYIASHGFAVRMLLQTDLLKRLRDSGYKVTLFTTDPDDQVLKTYAAEHGISLKAFGAKGTLTHPKYQLLRTYFLEDLYSNPALMEKHHYQISRRTSNKEKRWRWLWKLLLLFHPLIRKTKFIPLLFERWEKRMLRRQPVPDHFGVLQPDLFVSTYPAHPMESILLYQAKTVGITTCIHLLSWDNISCKGRFYTLADAYLSWGPIMTEEYQAYYGIAREKIHECGVCHFDLHETILRQETDERYFGQLGLQKDVPIIFFGMSSPRFVPNEIDVVETVASWVESNRLGSDTMMVIRPHPQNVSGPMADAQWLSRLEKIQSARVRVFYPMLVSSHLPWSLEREDMVALSSILKHACVCINSCSTLSVDALMLGVPNLAPMYDGHQGQRPYWHAARRLLDYTHIKKFIADGGAEIAHSEDELYSKLQSMLHNKTLYAKLAERARIRQTGTNCGRATDLAIQALQKITG